MVDAGDNLWIIDFSSSYTEGWVDSEIVETKKGDNIRVDKIVDTLKDPEENVASSETSENDQDTRVASTNGQTRKREDEFDETPNGERRKKSLSEK